MRLWTHVIWLEANPHKTLATAGPREDRKLEELIRAFPNEGELTVALAWHFYVTEEPRPYNLEPVNIASKNVSKAGATYISEAQDHSSITRFPLSAFLATSDGYLVRARMEIDKVLKLREQHGPTWPKHDDRVWSTIEPAVRAMRKQIGTMQSKWGAANDFDEENVQK